MENLSLYDFNIEEVRRIADTNSLTRPILEERALIKNKILEAAECGFYECQARINFPINRQYFSRLKFALISLHTSPEEGEGLLYRISW